MSDFEFARIPAGVLTLQDARREEQRVVTLEPFEIGVYPVTEEQLAEVLGIPVRHPRRPASDLSWLRAIHFCNAASEWEGLDRVYLFDGEDVSWDTTADGYRLPTEAEWEFACRAGSTGPHYAPLADAAWTSADGVSSPQDIGGKLPNLHGLFDTLGNVWEWCWDWFDPYYYKTSPIADPRGAQTGRDRAIRGGAINGGASTSGRYSVPPGSKYEASGFRIVLPVY